MKLYEIFADPEDTWKEDRPLMNDIPDEMEQLVNKKRAAKNHKMLGAGINAYVSTDDYENFGDVSRISSDADGGAVFLQHLVADKKYATNPFFPKVRKLTKNGEVQVAVIERLIPFKTGAILNSLPLMAALWSSYFNEPWAEAIADWGRNPMINVHAVMDECVNNRTIDAVVKHPKLKEALYLIRNMMDEYDVPESDIHSGNIMWRMSLHSPQLVIVDPIAL